MTGHLCLSCNLCCDGTLFDFVIVTEAEAVSLPAQTPIDRVEGHHGMRQACVHLGGDGCCAIYTDRPQKCAAFDCTLLKGVMAGEVTRTAADESVASAKALIAQARAKFAKALGPDVCDGVTLRRLMHALIDAQDRIDPAAFDAAKQAFLSTAVYLEDHFHKS